MLSHFIHRVVTYNKLNFILRLRHDIPPQAAETATSFQFDAAFDGNGNLQSVSNLPAGWSSSITGNKVTVTHTAAKMVKNISYWGKDASLGWQLRFPNAGFQATIPVGNETTQFILDINASVAGADASSTAKVNVIFQYEFN